MENTEAVLNQLGWQYKISGNQLILSCPFCQKKDHFYIGRENGLWDCKVCFMTGNLYKLKAEFLPSFVKKPRIIPVKTIAEPTFEIKKRNYLSEKRKISQEVIERMKINFEPYKVGFTYRTPEGKPYLVKWRNTQTKEFYSEPKAKIQYPYNIENMKTDKDIIICEGEIDALTYMTYGFDNVISIPGAGSFKGEWIKLFKQAKTIYLSLDNDDAGDKGLKKIAQKLENNCLCKKIKLSHKDINECLQKGLGAKEILDSVNNAEKLGENPVLHTSEYTIKAPTQRDFGLKTGWDDLDTMVRWRDSELTVLTAHTKAGKTTFMTNVVLNQLMENKPVLLCSFEMQPEEIIKKMLSIIMGKQYYSRETTAEEIKSAQSKLHAMPLYILNHYGSMELDQLLSLIEYSDKYFDTGLVLLDHLQYFLPVNTPNMVQDIGNAMRKIKALTNKLENHIWLICHPRKTSGADEISEFTLRGSAEISQICDNLLILKSDLENYKTELTLQLSRSSLSKAGKVKFDFNPESLEYKIDYSDEIPKEWSTKKSKSTPTLKFK